MILCTYIFTYDRAGWKRLVVGRRALLDGTCCTSDHCTWSFNHPQLESFLTHFQEYVHPNQSLLAKILMQSDSTSFRAAAAFLLAHADITPNELVTLLSPAVRDPESNVRNASMRVIYYVVRANDNIELDLDLIIEALSFPSFTDRNKALVILRSLPLDNLNALQRVRLAPMLLEILEKKDAHNYRNAHTVIVKMSGLDLSIDDLEGWRSWVNRTIQLN